ncbi:MAG: hypothetical protein DHS20C20_03430 [Ardenticatenaceae bacterium]|nr:MAG: hypothetical protein DHS20C20_03430 [Ardenticatenaceae bacterium]
MKPVNKPKQTTDPDYTYKTKDDFLRWLRKREALKKQAAKEQLSPPKRPARPRKK